ncbi:MAG: AAA family ATPase [Shimia sp.]|uniref:AAA family ATPase n=1 Tax=Shimia sp. TaxID=1954381 RepID=UPI001B1F3FFB|nr:AAA family ATPase [Shimia sp.]MBO6898132.1 AAA family ATPase [Shimia sp.]
MLNTNPKTTADMVFADSVSETLVRALLNQTLPFPIAGKSAVLLYGTFGSGKTTYADIFCRDFEEQRGGSRDDTVIDFVSCDSTENITQILKRCESIRETISFNTSGLHYFVFDEVDNLTNEAQRKLKAFLNYSNIVCVLTTNYVDKVDDGVKSRCHMVNFNATDTANYLHRVKQIIRQNRLPMPSDAQLLAKIENADGDWRNIVPYVMYLCNSLQPTPPKQHKLKVV